MTDKIEIVRVKPCDLSRAQIIRLNCTYKTELGDFIVIAGAKQDKLYVNETVSQEDVNRFIQMCEYDGDEINDESCPIAEVNNYVYEKYGSPVWCVLLDLYRGRMKQRKKAEAKIAAEKCFRAIDEYRYDDESDVFFESQEYISYELSRLADSTGRKTCRNAVSIGSEYIFYLGYLMGNGIINLKEVLADGAAV